MAAAVPAAAPAGHAAADAAPPPPPSVACDTLSLPYVHLVCVGLPHASALASRDLALLERVFASQWALVSASPPGDAADHRRAPRNCSEFADAHAGSTAVA